jgi:hypothetical protein
MLPLIFVGLAVYDIEALIVLPSSLMIYFGNHDDWRAALIVGVLGQLAQDGIGLVRDSKINDLNNLLPIIPFRVVKGIILGAVYLCIAQSFSNLLDVENLIDAEFIWTFVIFTLFINWSPTLIGQMVDDKIIMISPNIKIFSNIKNAIQLNKDVQIQQEHFFLSALLVVENGFKKVSPIALLSSSVIYFGNHDDWRAALIVGVLGQLAQDGSDYFEIKGKAMKVLKNSRYLKDNQKSKTYEEKSDNSNRIDFDLIKSAIFLSVGKGMILGCVDFLIAENIPSALDSQNSIELAFFPYFLVISSVVRQFCPNVSAELNKLDDKLSAEIRSKEDKSKVAVLAQKKQKYKKPYNQGLIDNLEEWFKQNVKTVSVKKVSSQEIFNVRPTRTSALVETEKVDSSELTKEALPKLESIHDYRQHECMGSYVDESNVSVNEAR